MPYPDIITITDSISPGNMPYNEFVLYRYHHDKRYNQKVIVLFQEEISDQVDYPKDLQIFRCGTNLKKIKTAIASITEDSEKRNCRTVFHIHEAKSVLLFHIATGWKYKKQAVYTLHSTFSNYPLRNKLLASLASFLSRKVVCVSRTSYRHYPALFKRMLGDRAVCIQNGVDCERVNNALETLPADVKRSTEKKLRLIYVARLVSLKRHDILLQAMKNLPECEITFIGQGGQKETLQALVREYGIGDRIRFMGFIPRDEVFAQIKAHDIYVTSSSYEGLPVSLLEAMSCGVVCLASDIEQHREIQEQCSSLITVKNSPEDWVRAVKAIIGMPQEEQERIAEKNKRDVDTYFSLERMHKQYDLVYQKVIEE